MIWIKEIFNKIFPSKDDQMKYHVDRIFDKFDSNDNLNFSRALDFTLRWEGSYNKYSWDSETKYGITKASYPNLDIKNLTLQQAKDIYRKDYWNASGCDKLQWPLCLVVFDCSVNAGVKQSLKLLKRAQIDKDLAIYSDNVINERVKFYEGLKKSKNPDVRLRAQKSFSGWMNRVNDLRKTIK